MTKEEITKEILRIGEAYEEERMILRKKYESKLRAVAVPYAQSIARFKVGDVISCDAFILRIDHIGAKPDIKSGEVCPVYQGKELTKALKERKDNPKNGYQIVDNGKVEITFIKTL